MKIKADEELFNRFKYLGHKLSNLSCIVQNDMDVMSYEIGDFIHNTNEIVLEINTLKQLVLNHVEECNKEQ